MLSTCFVVAQLRIKVVVVLVRIVAERLVALQHDHRQASESDSLKTWPICLIAMNDGASLGLSDTERSCYDFERGNADGHDDGEGQPRQDDGHRQPMDRPRDAGRTTSAVHALIGHAALRRQKLSAFTSGVITVDHTSTPGRQQLLSLLLVSSGDAVAPPPRAGDVRQGFQSLSLMHRRRQATYYTRP